MKMPKLLTGWTTSDRKMHDTREEAHRYEIRQALLSAMQEVLDRKYKESRGYGLAGLYPEDVVDAVLCNFHIEPKVVEP